jgi:hypothetical protein
MTSANSVENRLRGVLARICARAVRTADPRMPNRARWACRAADRASGTRVGTVLWNSAACDSVDHSLYIGLQQRAVTVQS